MTVLRSLVWIGGIYAEIAGWTLVFANFAMPHDLLGFAQECLGEFLNELL